MNFSLFHKLFILIASAALLSALAMAIALSLNLRTGFSDYLEAQDREQLDEFAKDAAGHIGVAGTPLLSPDGTLDVSALLIVMISRGELPNALAMSTNRELSVVTAPQENLATHPQNSTQISGSPRPPGGFARRLMIFDLQGNQRSGPPPPKGAAAAKVLERAIVVDERVVAVAKLLPRRPSPRGEDANFLKSQYYNAGFIVFLLFILSALPAFLVARFGAKRLSEMQATAHQISKGDLTARVAVRGTDELSAMGRDINIMADSLTALDGNRRRWLAQISHELRTPLTVLTGELDALKDKIRPLNMLAMQSLSDEAHRLGRVVDDLHALAVADMSGTFCHFVACDAIGLVHEVYSRFALAFDAADIELKIEAGERTAIPVNWDPTRIGQLFANVMTNSLRYTSAPGKALVTLSSDETTICIRFDDSAPTVPDEHIGRLFEPLYRVDESRARSSGGSGLGLAVCEAIVNAHGGTIDAHRSVLGGISIVIALPIDASIA